MPLRRSPLQQQLMRGITRAMANHFEPARSGSNARTGSMTELPPSLGTERFDTVVIGAGQAGLATGYYLRQAGIDFVILDAAARLGASWRNRWDSLRLFTQAHWDDLPGMPFPAPANQRKRHLPTKDEMADFLEQYATRFSLPVRLGMGVERLSREGDRYVISAGARRIEARNVVVATGPFQRPRIPSFAPSLDSGILQLHSSAYRNAAQLQKGDTLVVGAATSGCQIAMELASEHRVFLSGRDVGIEPSGPIISLIFDPLVPWLFSQPRHTFIGKKFFQVARNSGHPLLGFDYKDVKRAGVERLPRVAGVRDGKPELMNGQTLDVTNVVWCTGYAIDFSWIDLPIFEQDGYPRHYRGVVDEAPGLYFIGLIFLYALRSHVIFGAGKDARHLVDQLIGRSASLPPRPPHSASRFTNPGAPS
jgi:putative flavoprotein involved in K+ transport